MSTSTSQDSATILSLNYLSAIESRLRIEWESPTRPICLVDNVSTDARKLLKSDLDDLLSRKESAGALTAAKAYGQDHIQTVGFGLAPDFDQFVKLGFLYGDRVVLWDFLANRLLVESRHIPGANIASTACELLLLKPAVERGALVILPHPMQWSNLAEMVAEDLENQKVRSSGAFGISMALTAVEEGLPLHPYTLLENEPKPQPLPKVFSYEDDVYSKETYIFQRAIRNLLKNQQFAYLNNLSAAEFQRIVAQHEGLHGKLRRFFNPTSGLSPQQREAELRILEKELPALIKKQNDAVSKYAGDGIEASAVFVTSLLTKLNAATMGKFVVAELGVRLVIALRKWFTVPEENIIVQAFNALKQQEEKETVLGAKAIEANPQPVVDFNAIEDGNLTTESEDAEFKQDRKAFWSQNGGTEGRHDFLLSLPFKRAVKIVKSLSRFDRQRLVNMRMYQEAYIAEYIGELWDIDRTAFWRHIETMFKSREGLIISDYEPHIEIMCREEMPSYVWLKLLKCLLSTDLRKAKGGFNGEFYEKIVVFQTSKAFEKNLRRLEFQTWFKGLNHEDRDRVLNFLRRTFNNKVPSWVRRKNPKSANEK